MTRHLIRPGPLDRILKQFDDENGTQVSDVTRVAFDTYAQGAELRFTAACWTIGSRAMTR